MNTSSKARLDAVIWPPSLLALCILACSPNDAVTSTSTVEALADAPSCTAATLSWAHGGSAQEQCSGVWKYQRFGSCQLRDPACGPQRCEAGWNTCQSWTFGADPIGVVSSHESAVRFQLFCSPAMSPRCSWRMQGVGCAGIASNHLARVQAQLPEAHRSLARIVPGSVSVGTPNSEGEARCTYQLSQPKAALGSGAVCGCRAPLAFPACTFREDARCGASGTWMLSAREGLTLEDLKALDPKAAGLEASSPADVRPMCSTCEHIPTPHGTPNDASRRLVQSKYQCLEESERMVTEPAHRSTIAGRKALVYELFGDQLSEAQRVDARQVYASFPKEVNSCGKAARDVEIPAACSASSGSGLDGTHGDLIRCQRLAEDHVSPALASLELEGCAEIFDRALRLAEGGDVSADARCEGEAIRSVLGAALPSIHEKQLDLLRADPEVLGALPRQLYLLNRWYDLRRRQLSLSSPSSLEPEPLPTELSARLQAVWSAVHARFGVFGDLDRELALTQIDADTVGSALETANRQGRAAEQAILTAAFTPIEVLAPDGIRLGRAPLQGVPLLAVMGDALGALLGRAEDLSTFHDFACQFSPCGAGFLTTPTVQAFSLLAQLEDASALQLALQDSGELSGWRSAFQRVQEQHAILRAAIDRVVGVGGDLASALPGTLPPSAARFAYTLGEAKLRYQSYFATGQFFARPSKLLHASVNERDRALVVNYVASHTGELQQAVDRYRGDMIGLAQSLSAEAEAHASEARVRNIRLARAEELDHLARDLDGLRASARDDERSFGDLASAYAELESTLDRNTFFALGDTQNFQFSGADAKYLGAPASVESMSAGSVMGLRAGQMLLVRSEGAWSPTCAIRSTRVLHPEGGGELSIEVADAETGPEGFRAEWSNSAYQARSATSQSTSTNALTVGARAEVCAGSLPSALSYKTCAYVDASHSEASSRTEGTSHGTDHRTSAFFSSGLRLRNTPYPELPVGALLVVLTAPGTYDVVDMQVVQRPATSVFIPRDSDAYFVVNDLECRDTPRQPTLQVTVNTMTSVGSVAPRVVEAMVGVVSELRALEAMAVAQGRLLPTQSTAVRSQANLELEHRLGFSRVNLPPTLVHLFDAFLDRELLRIERAVEAQGIERQMNAIQLELRSLEYDVAAASVRSRLSSLIPGWMLRNLEGEALRREATDVLTVTRDYFKPILDLWYPAALASVQASPDLALLLNIDLDASMLDRVGNAQRFLSDLCTAYQDATFGGKATGEALPVVVLSMPRPNSDDGDPFDRVFGTGSSAYSSPWRTLDPGRSKIIWDAIVGRGRGLLTVNPEDIYSRSGGDSVLSCDELIPVVKRMALYVIRPGASDNDSLNGLGRWISAKADLTQVFAGLEGPITYRLANSGSQDIALPVLYGEAIDARTRFLATPSQMRPLGLSPFGTFQIDFSALSTLHVQGAFDDARDLALVMELDSRSMHSRDGERSWIQQCVQ